MSGAIYWSRPDAVYYASTKKDAAEIGFDDHFIYDEIAMPMDQRSIPMKQVQTADYLCHFKRGARRAQNRILTIKPGSCMGKPGLFLFMDRDAEIGIECFGIFLCIARFKGVDAAGFVNSEFVIIHGVSAFCRTDGHPSRFVKRRIGAYSHQNDVVMKSRQVRLFRKGEDGIPGFFSTLRASSHTFQFGRADRSLSLVRTRPSTNSRGWRGPALRRRHRQ